ncbi:MAG TPA: hypothetical protein VNG71_03920, partial [Pyrinomonadaceae bacterium]|nr:hypothetical protein [Pyrinomonadaceae bacterium]
MKLTRFLKYSSLLLALLVTLAPVYWLITISFKREIDQFGVPPKWFSFAPTLEHYADAFLARSFGQYLLNSLVVAVASTICALIIGSLAAYSLARFRLPRNLDRHLALWIL